MQNLLRSLHLSTANPGTWSGTDARQSEDTSVIGSEDPATGRLIADVYATNLKQYDDVIDCASDAFGEWRKVPAPMRGEAIRRIGIALRDYKDTLGTLVSLETGKIKAEGDGEVQEMIDIADFAVGQSRMLYGRTMHSERPKHRMYEQWHPLGLVGIISAFNFPVAVWSWNAFIAAVCGNVNIWKPSPKTPLCGVAVQNICNEALAGTDFPPIFHLINDADNQVVRRFIDDSRIDLISFTGSCAVGRKVAERVTARMGKCLLELGGNNALIVDQYADMELAIPAILFGAVGTAGQRCTTTRRIIVHKSRFEELKAKLLAAYSQIRIGDPLDENILMGPLIDESAVHQYRKAVSRIRQLGGQILHGGQRLDRSGHFVEPVIAIVDNDWDIVQQETFAPILYLITYQTLDQAMSLHNSVDQGLSSAMFTDNLRHAEYFLSNAGSDCGIANINIGTSGAEIGGAFGGEKTTGGGREAGSDAWKAYMRRQTNTINWSRTLPLAQGIRFGD